PFVSRSVVAAAGTRRRADRRPVRRGPRGRAAGLRVVLLVARRASELPGRQVPRDQAGRSGGRSVRADRGGVAPVCGPRARAGASAGWRGGRGGSAEGGEQLPPRRPPGGAP